MRYLAGIMLAGALALGPLQSAQAADTTDHKVSIEEARATVPFEQHDTILDRIGPVTETVVRDNCSPDCFHVRDFDMYQADRVWRVWFELHDGREVNPLMDHWRVLEDGTVIASGSSWAPVAAHGDSPGCVTFNEYQGTYRFESMVHFTYRVGPDPQYEVWPQDSHIRYYRSCEDQTNPDVHVAVLRRDNYSFPDGHWYVDNIAWTEVRNLKASVQAVIDRAECECSLAVTATSDGLDVSITNHSGGPQQYRFNVWRVFADPAGELESRSSRIVLNGHTAHQLFLWQDCRYVAATFSVLPPWPADLAGIGSGYWHDPDLD